ncbi:trans-4-hydroxy-L-proline dehydratase [Desulfosporosinus sp. BICA1-9]|uniref:trans-4-hydroxy-L-proline dehydratase n=1 Tax=Desulfosporosinus sp. BICA1-9 TaxID=1531958 RepID=UPI00054B62C5|nr:trans-4-hydroxy-L-proline dehydratase [Desulfosporosinus sp. BICA1-9]KJS46434.1 MAG: formate acetyltransferase [Peptococcaceae bacterium BRH_c23]KJS86389.1 MAG: formate acetyltransferase [Desulfosporosinus sp. BICA1-9]
MNERVTMLRQRSLETEANISAERAELITDFYRSAGHTSVPVQRALAFKYLLEHKEICLNEGELIIGERGPAPKATYTYPELCCHSLEDLDILDSRPKISFKVSPEVRQTYAERIIPYWQGKSMRDLIFTEMSEEWKTAYDAGIFTEFMEQRAPGHTVLDDKIYRLGMLDFIADIDGHLAKLNYFKDVEAYYKQEELKAMRICAEAIIRFAERHAEKAQELAQVEADGVRKEELERIAEVSRYVPAHAPRNFWEALQAYWFVHLGVITELNTWDAFSPGRLDQHLYPFYKKGLAEGTLTEEQAKELLQCFWVKFNNQPAPPKVGVTAAESGTYTDFANINSGGLKADGSDGVNEVTYLVLDVIDEMRLLQPSSNIQLSKKNPDRFLKRAARIIRKGWGQPSVFNADTVVEELLRQGKLIEDARQGGTSGCVETGAFGKESYILTGYFNLPKILELVLHNGVDPRTAQQLGLKTGDPRSFESFEALFDAFKKQLHYFMNIKVRGSNIIERLYATYMPSPFLSLLIDDCVAKGKDYNDGGARYNTNYVQGVGLGSLTDMLSGLKYHIFDQKDLTLDQLLKALDANFSGHEAVRQLLINKTPHFGNDQEYADDVMVGIFNAYYSEVNDRPNTKGGVYRINMLPTTCHVYFGSVIGATAEGRRAWEPLSEGISPVQGMDRLGPTAVIKSASKLDHARTGGTLLNLKFTPQVLEGDDGINKLAQLVRSYFKLGGHHIQFNVVNAKTLRAAQAEPEKHRDLIVRVAGYSDYFCDLSEALQEEIITRTEHDVF